MATVGKRTVHQKKGDALEDAVGKIEKYLLKITPELREQDFTIETKKRVTVDGGQREIDIYVTHKGDHGYGAIFIYECRNRKKPVSWEDAAAFSRKIEATNATWGCFVARKFTKGARAEAKNDSRLRLLLAREIVEPVDLFIHLPQLKKLNITLRHFLEHEKVDYSNMPEQRALFRGWAVPLKRTFMGVSQDACMDDIQKFMTTRPSEGAHEFEKQATMPFSRFELIVNDSEIAAAILEIKYVVNVVRTAVTSHFLVETRGRLIKAEPVKLGEVELPVEIVIAN